VAGGQVLEKPAGIGPGIVDPGLRPVGFLPRRTGPRGRRCGRVPPRRRAPPRQRHGHSDRAGTAADSPLPAGQAKSRAARPGDTSWRSPRPPHRPSSRSRTHIAVVPARLLACATRAVSSGTSTPRRGRIDITHSSGISRDSYPRKTGPGRHCRQPNTKIPDRVKLRHRALKRRGFRSARRVVNPCWQRFKVLTARTARTQVRGDARIPVSTPASRTGHRPRAG
jgi:hypothetical protein